MTHRTDRPIRPTLLVLGVLAVRALLSEDQS